MEGLGRPATTLRAALQNVGTADGTMVGTETQDSPAADAIALLHYGKLCHILLVSPAFELCLKYHVRATGICLLVSKILDAKSSS